MTLRITGSAYAQKSVKYMISVFAIALSRLCDKILSHLVAGETINMIEKALIWIKMSNVVFVGFWYAAWYLVKEAVILF